MTKLFDTIDTDHLSVEDAVNLFNAYSGWRSAEAEESVFDLYDDEDSILWVNMYGIGAYRKCVRVARFWIGGTNYYYNEEDKKSWTQKVLPVEDKIKLIAHTCDELEGLILDYIEDHIATATTELISDINSLLFNIIDVSPWLEENGWLPKMETTKYGRTWRVFFKKIIPNTAWKMNPKGTDDWCVCTLPEGELWLNNIAGYVMLLEENKTLFSSF